MLHPPKPTRTTNPHAHHSNQLSRKQQQTTLTSATSNISPRDGKPVLQTHTLSSPTVGPALCPNDLMASLNERGNQKGKWAGGWVAGWEGWLLASAPHPPNILPDSNEPSSQTLTRTLPAKRAPTNAESTPTTASHAQGTAPKCRRRPAQAKVHPLATMHTTVCKSYEGLYHTCTIQIPQVHVENVPYVYDSDTKPVARVPYVYDLDTLDSYQKCTIRISF